MVVAYSRIISDMTSCIQVCSFSTWQVILFLFGPGAGAAVEHTDPTRCDSNSVWSDSRLLQHFVQSCLLYGSRGNLLLVSQILKFPFLKYKKIEMKEDKYTS